MTQVVLTFPTGPTNGGCPKCLVATNIQTRPFTEPGTSLTVLNVPGDDSLVLVITLSNSDIAHDSGLPHVSDETGLTRIPTVGLATDTSMPPAPFFFNALFPLNIK